MSLFKKLFTKKKKPSQEAVAKTKSTLIEDIYTYSQWAVDNLTATGYLADYSLESMKDLDRFFDEQIQPGGVLAQEKVGGVLFALGAYVGQTVIKLYGGEWLTDDNDPEGELKIAVKVATGRIIWPVLRCMKRLQNGSEDSLYAYVLVFDPSIERMTGEEFIQRQLQRREEED